MCVVADGELEERTQPGRGRNPSLEKLTKHGPFRLPSSAMRPSAARLLNILVPVKRSVLQKLLEGSL